MQLIVDANVLFAALIKDSTTRELLLSNELSLLVPEFIIEEFEKHTEELKVKTKLSERELSSLVSALITGSEIEIIPKEAYMEFLKRSKEISPDPEDVQYFALALKYNCPIWSNEERLKGQRFVKILSTHELVESLKS